MEQQTEVKRSRGRTIKYDFSVMQKVGDSVEFEPAGKSFSKRHVRNITSALVQYRRMHKPSNMYATRSIAENGKILKVIVILINT
jgi:tRNA U38,U39,U40 pseudouridine synthase TruA